MDVDAGVGQGSSMWPSADDDDDGNKKGGEAEPSLSSSSSGSTPSPSAKKAASRAPLVVLYKLDTAILEQIFLYLRPCEVLKISMLCTEAWSKSLIEWMSIVEGHFKNPVTLIDNLHRLPRLHTLDLTGNEMGVEGARALASLGMNGHCCELSSLNLSQNNLGEEGLRELTNAWSGGWGLSIRSVDLSHNYVGPGGLALVTSVLVSGHLPSLDRLDLSCNTTTEAFASGDFEGSDFRAFCRLSSLRLFANGLRVEEAVQLATAIAEAPQVRLQCLDLSWNHLQIEGARHLLLALNSRGGRGNAPLLTHLNLRHNDIDSGDTAPLPGFPNGLATALPNIIELDLGENQIGDRWARELSQILREGGWRKILKLDLSSNSITDMGANDLKAAIASEGSTSLKTLILKGNSGISEDLLKEIEGLQESMATRG